MNKRRKIFKFLVVFFAVGFLLPERRSIPVEEARASDWNKDSFWYEPWGASGVHKGIDIFSKRGKAALSPIDGMVVYAGNLGRGGNIIVVLGPKWRFHYLAHLDTIDTSVFSVVGTGEAVGAVGDTGNAKGKQPHLHYSIVRLVPVPWAIDSSTQGYKKSIFINPSAYLAGQP